MSADRSEDRSAAEAPQRPEGRSEDRSAAEAPQRPEGRSEDRSAAAIGDVAGRLAEVRERIAAAGADPADVTVVAVTKGHGAAAAVAAVDAGLFDVGENYAADLAATAAAVAAGGRRARFHFLGRVQRNKVKVVADVVGLWQGVDRRAAGQEIARRRPGAEVLVQVNLSGERAKNGCGLDEAEPLVDDLVEMGIDVRGLMGIGPAGGRDPRPGFRALVELADRLGLGERSIGMTDDFEVAVAEGATMIRLGRGLFGPRNGGDDLRR